ncbi:MAG: 50S ribosomal protein L1 [Candidatus Altiarchaeota archaeon]
MDKKTIVDAITDALGKSKKRKFVQTVEAGFIFTDVDLDSTQHKLNLNVYLPKGRGRDIDIGVFADGDMAVRAKKVSKNIYNKAEIETLSKDRRKMRKIASDCYSFIAQPDLMTLIGKNWGIVLGSRGKMPQPVPPNADLTGIMNRTKNSVRVRSKKNPAIHVPIGVESMNPEDLYENYLAVYNAIERVIPKDKIKSVYVKTTMGEAVKLW